MRYLSPCQVAQIGTSIANALCLGKCSEEICILKNIISQILSTMQTILFQQTLIERNKS